MALKAKKHPEKQDDSAKSEVMHRFKMHPFLFVGTVVVLVIVIIAFVFVPAIVPNVQGGGGDFTFGYYNKVPIRYAMNNYFYNAQQYFAQSQQQSNPDETVNMFVVAQIWQQAFEETAVHMGILDEMKTAGFIVPEDKVDREMAALPQFQDAETGKFSVAKYRAMDNSTLMNLRQQVRESLISETYMADLGNLKTPSKEPAFISAMADPQRSFDAAVFPLSAYPDSEIASYVSANPDLFKMIRLSQITISSSEREARQILDSIKNGVTTFEDAARANSQDWAADRGGDMGSYMTHELSYTIGNEDARAAVVTMAAGVISDIYQVDTGWAFYRVDEAAYPADINDAAQKTKIQTYMMQNQRGPVEDWAIAEAGKFAARANETTLDQAISEAGTASGVTKSSFGPISLNYGDSPLFSSIAGAGVPALASAGANQTFWNAAFATPLNSLSEPFVVGDNVIVLLPKEEVPVEESSRGFIESYYPYWSQTGTGNATRSYFLNNEKLDNRFQEAYWKLWGTNQS